MKIKIEWPEKNSSEVFTIERILDIYTPKEIESGFLGKLEGNARFILECDSGEVIVTDKGSILPNALKPYIQDWDKRTINRALYLSKSL